MNTLALGVTKDGLLGLASDPKSLPGCMPEMGRFGLPAAELKFRDTSAVCLGEGDEVCSTIQCVCVCVMPK